ncbi:hypothetical protein GA0111570_106124 [Raineyella antarctica]|uniref:Uncharacterized protein n=1 Tax=Raineyella antarctica TaxID=1577474 RepID=A0A1G6H3L6_9ACTN|nr:DUF5995 family protein [Raineyella antarctica]SDB88771.1 hypothetical protein GA0111570_106124 [Raineyella antarctica]
MTIGPSSGRFRSIAGLMTDMRRRLGALPADDPARAFLSTYLRTTAAVAEAIDAGTFEDPVWVEEWDLAFADLYLRALDAHLSGAGTPASPWLLAFDAAPRLTPLLNVLLGINAHINYDLPQALLAVISDTEVTDGDLLARRRRDHERIDQILASRVAAEDLEISARSVRSLLDRALRPINRWAAKRFLKEARAKVWSNTLQLSQARAAGADVYESRLRELELLAAARIADLLAPGQVLLRLARVGFGVTLPLQR